MPLFQPEAPQTKEPRQRRPNYLLLQASGRWSSATREPVRFTVSSPGWAVPYGYIRALDLCLKPVHPEAKTQTKKPADAIESLETTPYHYAFRASTRTRSPPSPPRRTTFTFSLPDFRRSCTARRLSMPSEEFWWRPRHPTATPSYEAALRSHSTAMTLHAYDAAHPHLFLHPTPSALFRERRLATDGRVNQRADLISTRQAYH